MDEKLQRILQKVEAGELLSDDELSALKDASPLAFAQALINAEQAETALRILRRLEQEQPKNPQVKMALGRALVSLERWREAEPVIREANGLQPDDPEPLKALAALAMRRGERALALQHIRRALAADPLDGEAQQILGELEAPAALPQTGNAVPLFADFSKALRARLQSQSTPHLLQRDQLLVRMGKGGVARLELKQLYRNFLDSHRPLDESVAMISKELAERALGLPQGKDELLRAVLPVLRTAEFLDVAQGVAHREGPAGLLILYVIEDPELVRYVPSGALDTHGVTLEQLDDAAWKRLDEKPVGLRSLELEQGALRISETPTGLWALAGGDGHDAARLLTPAHRAVLEEKFGTQPLRVYLGLRELVMLCPESDAAWSKRLGNMDAAKDGIAGTFRYAEGRLTALSSWD
jgi:tetratricopeptide (TPR) repeat protein